MVDRLLHFIPNSLEWAKRNERWIFFLVVAWQCHIFFINRYFPTLDGPAHLYNSNLIAHFLSGEHFGISDFYSLNPVLVPNWSGHALLAFFQLFFSGAVAEKLFLTFYIFSFSYAFRYLITGFNRDNGLLALLGLPFATGAFLYFGFYNFSLAIVVLFVVIGFAARRPVLEPIDAFRLAGWMLLLYFSHITILAVALMFLAAYYVSVFLLRGWDRSDHRKQFLSNSIIAFCGILPSLLLALVYRSHHASPDASYTWIDPQEILLYLKRLNGLIFFTNEEEKFTRYYLYFFISALILLPVTRFIFRNPFGKWLKESDLILLFSVLFLVAAFTLPDSDTKGGFITLRVVFLIHLFVLIWIISQRWNFFLQLLILAPLMYIHFRHVHFRNVIQKPVAQLASDIQFAAQHLNDGDVVLPVHYSDNWVLGHISNYLGADKKVVILENYETIQDYFPLRWKPMAPVPPITHPFADAACGELYPWVNGQYTGLTHVFVLHGANSSSDQCEQAMRQPFENRWELKYSSQFCSLYALRNQ